MKDVTVVAPKLKYFIISLVVFKADRARVVQVKCQVCIGHRLHRIDNVQSSLTALAIPAQLSANEEYNVAYSCPVHDAHNVETNSQHSNEVTFVLTFN